MHISPWLNIWLFILIAIQTYLRSARASLLNMCHRTRIQYRCNHQKLPGGIGFCSMAGKPKAPGGRKTMCHEVRNTTMRASSDICGDADCTLFMLGGKWECCKCKENGNRFLLCDDNGNCNHPICQSCSSASWSILWYKNGSVFGLYTCTTWTDSFTRLRNNRWCNGWWNTVNMDICVYVMTIELTRVARPRVSECHSLYMIQMNTGLWVLFETWATRWNHSMVAYNNDFALRGIVLM